VQLKGFVFVCARVLIHTEIRGSGHVISIVFERRGGFVIVFGMIAFWMAVASTKAHGAESLFSSAMGDGVG
jgi:hypothetical protein